ncbi:hypothetical protein EJ03DRAFT_332681 [Teratosphaeria nubilosa]|uniref:Uncharacterized protein n=1 Tax=Teratosphaeria nubilosa TaxID=161662 RepID=A0A6G1LMS5_9PEZI|nr:hypothetical protein EJ03DRAFT_332681 [Teratosphaeria nubilosa]
MVDSTEDGHRLELSQVRQQQSDITKLLASLVDAQKQSNEFQRQNNELQKQNNELQKQNNELQHQNKDLLTKWVEHQDDQALNKITSRPPINAGTLLAGWEVEDRRSAVAWRKMWVTSGWRGHVDRVLLGVLVVTLQDVHEQ